MKTLISIVLVALALTGCSSLNYAGVAKYTVKPFKDDAGALICCEVSVENGKEIARLDAHIQKTGTDYVVDLKEYGVVAFKGQEIAAGAAGDAAKVATTAAVVTGGVLAAPALAPLVGAAATAGTLPAAAVGAAAGVGATKVLSK